MRVEACMWAHTYTHSWARQACRGKALIQRTEDQGHSQLIQGQLSITTAPSHHPPNPRPVWGRVWQGPSGLPCAKTPWEDGTDRWTVSQRQRLKVWVVSPRKREGEEGGREITEEWWRRRKRHLEGLSNSCHMWMRNPKNLTWTQMLLWPPDILSPPSPHTHTHPWILSDPAPLGTHGFSHQPRGFVLG